jgi:uncharacterized protein YndB with AHSA1/START domain
VAATRKRAASAQKKNRELVVTRTLDAPRALVFRAWTDPAQLVRWWGPEGFTTPECKMDVREGGAWRTCMRSPDGNDYKVRGVYREIVKPERLVFTWTWEDDSGATGHETLVTVTFAERAGKTLLRLAHRIFESKKARDAHQQGWASTLNCLAAFLAEGGGARSRSA